MNFSTSKRKSGRLRDQQGITGKTLQELSEMPFARGVYLRKITRSMVEMPILPGTEVLRGDIVTMVAAKNTSRPQ